MLRLMQARRRYRLPAEPELCPDGWAQGRAMSRIIGISDARKGTTAVKFRLHEKPDGLDWESWAQRIRSRDVQLDKKGTMALTFRLRDDPDGLDGDG